MKITSKVGIVCCSNGLSQSYENKIIKLMEVLKQIGLNPVLGDCIYEDDLIRSRTGIKRAKALMNLYKDDEIEAIFDISGGDVANEILSYLDFDIIGKSKKQFFGYSDLTTIINGIYAETNKTSVLYQVRNLMYDDAENQIKYLTNTLINNTKDLFDFKYHLIQGEPTNGIVVGGNIRCLLKLAGTKYWPDMTDKILLLEAYSGMFPQLITYFSQLKQLEVFDQIKGILLGTFTELEGAGYGEALIELVKEVVGGNLTVAKTYEIGHGTNSKGIVIGSEIHLSK